MSSPGIGGQRLSKSAWNLIEQYAWLRRMLGYSQREMDDRVGGACFIEKLEAGVRNPSLETLTKWAEAMGATLVLVPALDPEKRLSPGRRQSRAMQERAILRAVAELGLIKSGDEL